MKINDLLFRSLSCIVKLLLSFCIVAFGQPARMAWLCPIASVLGFALFFSVFMPLNSKKQRFWIATIWFIAVQMIQLSWMTSIEYQGYYILFVYFIVCCAIGAQFGVLAMWVPQGTLRCGTILALSALWTIMEWSRVHVSCGFSWNPIGLSLSFHEIPLQWASLFGIFGLSFWVMFINLFALKILRDANRLRMHLMMQLCVWGFMASLPYLFGVLHLKYHTQQMLQCEKTACVALVQTGLLPTEKVFHSHATECYLPSDCQWERIVQFIKNQNDASHPWDLIILPEAAVPKSAEFPASPLESVCRIFRNIYGPNVGRCFPKITMPFAEKKMHLGIEKTYASNLFWGQTIANIYDCDLVIGLDHFDSSNNIFYNSAFLLTSQHEEVVQRYDKRVLLPLAEYLPFEWLRPLTKSYGIYDFFTQGKDPLSLKGRLTMGVSICYEETFSHVIRKHVQRDCDLLINLTNDNYYPHSLLPEQHFTHARLRTVENGCALLRACNTGVTAAIDSLGRIIDRFGEKRDEFKCGVLQCTLVPYRYKTLFSIWGDVGLIGICMGILIFFCGVNIFLSLKYFLKKTIFRDAF